MVALCKENGSLFCNRCQVFLRAAKIIQINNYLQIVYIVLLHKATGL